jgi:hypothetical protein
MVIKFHSSQRAMPIWVPTLCTEAAHMLGTIHRCRKLFVVVVVVVQGATQLVNEKHDEQSPRSSVEKMDNFLASRRWLGFFNFYPEMGLESEKLIG